MRISLFICGLCVPTVPAFSPLIRLNPIGADSYCNRVSSLHAERETTKEKEDDLLFMTEHVEDKTEESQPNELVEAFKGAALEGAEALKGAAIEGAKDLFVALRWTAANALTSALPDTQREELLNRMDPEKPKVAKHRDGDDDADDELVRKNSVAEEVAASLARESQREKKKWEREKEVLMKQAETAAKKRVESDLAVQKQRMEQEQRKLREQAAAAEKQLEKEKQALKEKQEAEKKELESKVNKEQQVLKQKEAKVEKEQQALTKALKVKNEVEEKMKKELQALKEKAQQEAQAAAKAKADVHPILGPVVSDLGYKRIYLVPAGKLATIPVWRKQRIYRHDRAKAMAADKLKTLHLGLPGVICVHEEENGKLSILDGQHRVGMMQLLQEKQEREQKTNGATAAVTEPPSTAVANYIDLDRVLVEVYPQKPQFRSKDHAEAIFMEINKAEPIKLVDLPGVAKPKDRKIITQAVMRLQDKYPEMFSPSQQCRVPNINVDNLRDTLFAANVIPRHTLTTATKLLDWILKQNKLLGEKYENDVTAQSVYPPKAWKKASKFKFYLGLESGWLYN